MASVQGQPWPLAFLALIRCNYTPEPEYVRQEIQQALDKHLLQDILSWDVRDFKGRVVFRTPQQTSDEKEEKLRTRYIMSVYREICRRIMVNGAINPIRWVISEEHPVSVDVVQDMIRPSPFIPPGHEYIFARAIIQFLAGEDTEAASMLVPQLENSLRHIFAHKGFDTTAINAKGIQTEASLPVLLDPGKPWRRELVKILPNRYIHEIDLLFNFAGGPSLRNQVAHGKVPANGFSTANMVYASWLIINIAVLPLERRWDNGDEPTAPDSSPAKHTRKNT